ARAVDEVRGLVTHGVLGSIRVVNHAAQVVTETALDAVEDAAPRGEGPLLPMRSDVMKSWGWVGDAALGMVNGAIGDTLYARDNGLGLGMQLRLRDAFLPDDPAALREALAGAGPKIAIFVHGLGTTEWSWCLEAAAYHGDPSICFGTL